MSGVEYFETDRSEYPEPQKEYRFRVRASNGEIVAQSEGYTSQQARNQAAEALLMAVAPGIIRSFLTEEHQSIDEINIPGADLIQAYLETRLMVLDREGVCHARERNNAW